MCNIFLGLLTLFIDFGCVLEHGHGFVAMEFVITVNKCNVAFSSWLFPAFPVSF